MCARSTASWGSPREPLPPATPSNTTWCETAPPFRGVPWHSLAHGNRHSFFLFIRHAFTRHNLPLRIEGHLKPSIPLLFQENPSVLTVYSQSSCARLVSRTTAVQTQETGSTSAWKNAKASPSRALSLSQSSASSCTLERPRPTSPWISGSRGYGRAHGRPG